MARMTIKRNSSGLSPLKLLRIFMNYSLFLMVLNTEYAGIDQSYDKVVNVCEDVRPVHKKLNSKKSQLFVFPGTFLAGYGVVCKNFLAYANDSICMGM